MYKSRVSVNRNADNHYIRIGSDWGIVYKGAASLESIAKVGEEYYTTVKKNNTNTRPEC